MFFIVTKQKDSHYRLNSTTAKDKYRMRETQVAINLPYGYVGLMAASCVLP